MKWEWFFTSKNAKFSRRPQRHCFKFQTSYEFILTMSNKLNTSILIYVLLFSPSLYFIVSSQRILFFIKPFKKLWNWISFFINHHKKLSANLSRSMARNISRMLTQRPSKQSSKHVIDHCEPSSVLSTALNFIKNDSRLTMLSEFHFKTYNSM